MGITMNPDSISSTVMPGNLVYNNSAIQAARGKPPKKRVVDFEHGYFWMLKDLRRCNDKPILSNREIIPESLAKTFPTLKGLQSLAGETKLDLPAYCLRKNRTQDASAQCTLITICFRDFGYQMMSSWIDPFRQAMSVQNGNDRAETLRLNVSEGYINSWLLRGILPTLMKRGISVEDQASTLLYFSSNAVDFRDALRMHNVVTAYAFLLDGQGRVRFAGSGPATADDIDCLTSIAQQILQGKPSTTSTTSKSQFQYQRRSGKK
jgi:mitochondrial ATPase complex subunit ATP10